MSKVIIPLTNNRKIIIKKADKEATVVVINKADNIKEGVRQLSDTNFHIKLHHEPTPDHINKSTTNI